MIKIRNARLDDINTIIKFDKGLIDGGDEIIKSSYPQHLTDFSFKLGQEKTSRNLVKKAIYSKNGLVLILEKDNQPVGYILTTIRKNFPFFKLEKYAKLQTIYIKEEFRGKGFSSKLKDEVFKWCKRKEVKRTSLDVLPMNLHAIHVYEKWGFSPFLLEMRMDV